MINICLKFSPTQYSLSHKLLKFFSIFNVNLEFFLLNNRLKEYIFKTIICLDFNNSYFDRMTKIEYQILLKKYFEYII